MNVKDEAEKTVVLRKASSAKGGEWHGACPGCGDGGKGKDSDRFHVWPEQDDGRGTYWCRQCGKGGDLIQFFIDFCGKSFPEAAKLAGREIDDAYRYKAPRPPKVKDGRVSFVPVDPSVLDRRVGPWKEKAAKFVGWANTKLLKSSEMLGWLAARGISQQSAIEFKLGWNPGDEKGRDLFRTRESWGLNTIEKADGKRKRLWIPKGIVIPYMQGEDILRVKIRRFENDDRPRYYFLPGGSPEIMVLGPRAKAHVLVESELDAMLVFQECRDMNVGVVALGTSKAKPDKPAHGVLSGSLKILNALDFDEAGTSAGPWWEEQFGRRCELWPVPFGKDPGEAFQAGVNIREWVREGLPPVMKVEPSRLSEKRAGGAMNARPISVAAEKSEGVAETEVGNGYPPSVNELFRYMRAYPVKIKNTPNRLSMLCQEAWEKRNWGLSQKISSLVFLDPECLAFLTHHPAEIIDGRNFFDAENDTEEKQCMRMR